MMNLFVTVKNAFKYWIRCPTNQTMTNLTMNMRKTTPNPEALMNQPVTESQQLRYKIILHEGVQESAYQDSLGFWTIGVGRLIDKRKGGKLSIDEINMLLNNDIAQCKSELSAHMWFANQDEVRQGVLIELCFNMGLTNLLKFQLMLKAILAKDYYAASTALINSEWAREVSRNRVLDLQFRLEKGRYS